MEYIDVLDKNGGKTGVVKSKPDVHRDGDWHLAVHVWILNSHGELLIQKRSLKKENYPNLWDVSVGGHVSAGEDSITCVLRETEEELGVKLRKEDIEHLFVEGAQAVLNNGTYVDNEIHDIYLVRADIEISAMKLQKEEVAQVRFVHWKELKKEIADSPDDFVPHKNEYQKLFEYLVRM